MAITQIINNASFISHFVGERLVAKGLIHSPVPLKRHMQGGEDPDSKLVFLREGRKGFVVTVSPPEFPEVVAQECLKAAQMRSFLGDMGGPILQPLDTGRIYESSYAVLPYRKPLSKRHGLKRIHRLWMKHHLLRWLCHLAQRRSGACDISRYEASLIALGQVVSAGSDTAVLLRMAEKRLLSGGFAPRSAPMHGDLWGGNVLCGTASTPFTLIDWRGSETDGFPVFDLIRVAQSFGLSAKALRRELQLHRAALGCQMDDLALYVLGALGHYAVHIGEMQPALFRDMADECVQRLWSAVTLKAPALPLHIAEHVS